MNQRLIEPLQPYFMLYNQSSYQEKHVNFEGVSHFYCFTLAHTAMDVNAVPDGSIDIVIKLHDTHPEAWVCGSSKTPRSTLMEKGCSYFGVRYQIGVAPDFLSIQPKEVMEQTIPLHELSSLSEPLLDGLSQCDNFEAYMATFQRICGRRTGFVERSELSQTLVALMIAQRGNISVAELTKYSGYSARTINNTFNNYYGLSPKTFSLILKYQQVLDQLMQSNGERLTDLATDMGYADQSHLCRQFKRYNGQAPREFQNILKQYQYQT